MAKALLRVNTTSNHSYDDNDIVVIVDDNHEFGKEELDTNVFKVSEIPGKSAKELQYLIAPDLESPIKLLPPSFKKNEKLMIKFLLNKDILNNIKTINQRRYQIDNNNEIIDKRNK